MILIIDILQKSLLSNVTFRNDIVYSVFKLINCVVGSLIICLGESG
jgi:hypothetical protein